MDWLIFIYLFFGCKACSCFSWLLIHDAFLMFCHVSTLVKLFDLSCDTDEWNMLLFFVSFFFFGEVEICYLIYCFEEQRCFWNSKMHFLILIVEFAHWSCNKAIFNILFHIAKIYAHVSCMMVNGSWSCLVFNIFTSYNCNFNGYPFMTL